MKSSIRGFATSKVLCFRFIMECLIGMAFDDFVMVAADQTNARSIMVMKSDQNKFINLSDRLVMAVSGESGDTNQFAEYIAKNIQLYKMRNGYGIKRVFQIYVKWVKKIQAKNVQYGRGGLGRIFYFSFLLACTDLNLFQYLDTSSALQQLLISPGGIWLII